MTPVELMVQEYNKSHRDCRFERLLAVEWRLLEVPLEYDEGGLILESCRCCQDSIVPERETGETSVGIPDSNAVHFAAFTFGTETADDYVPGRRLPICKRCLQDALKLVDKTAIEYALKMAGELKVRLWPEFIAELEKMGGFRRAG